MRYVIPGSAQAVKPDSALICADCGWAPPPYHRYGVGGRPNKTAWTQLYHEHRQVMHEPHSVGCGCVVCVKRGA